VPADPVQAIKWHLIAKASGDDDAVLESFMHEQKPEIQAAGEKAAQPWLAAIKESHS
jgi:hypothetical protein